MAILPGGREGYLGWGEPSQSWGQSQTGKEQHKQRWAAVRGGGGWKHREKLST